MFSGPIGPENIQDPRRRGGCPQGEVGCCGGDGRLVTLGRMGGYRPWLDDLADRSTERPPPGDDEPELDWLLYEQERVLTRRQALAHITEDRLRHLVGSGQWQRTRAGLYVAHNGPLGRGQQLWAAVLDCGDGAVLAGITAACEGGLRRDPGRPIHVLVPAASRPNQPGRAVVPATASMPTVVPHRTSWLPASDIVDVARPQRTTMARSLVDAAQWAAGEDEARAFVAAGCQQRRTTPDEILAVVRRMPRARRRGIVLETIGYTSRGAEAISEISFLALCRRYGLPAPDFAGTPDRPQRAAALPRRALEALPRCGGGRRRRAHRARDVVGGHATAERHLGEGRVPAALSGMGDPPAGGGSGAPAPARPDRRGVAPLTSRGSWMFSGPIGPKTSKILKKRATQVARAWASAVPSGE